MDRYTGHVERMDCSGGEVDNFRGWCRANRKLATVYRETVRRALIFGQNERNLRGFLHVDGNPTWHYQFEALEALRLSAYPDGFTPERRAVVREVLGDTRLARLDTLAESLSDQPALEVLPEDSRTSELNARFSRYCTAVFHDFDGLQGEIAVAGSAAEERYETLLAHVVARDERKRNK